MTGLRAASLDLGAQLVRVVPRVRDESIAMRVVEQFASRDHLVPLARSQRDVERPAFRIDGRMDRCSAIPTSDLRTDRNDRAFRSTN
jgi:hypothetical protein